MKIEEAIKILERWKAGGFATRIDDMNPALQVVIEAAKEKVKDRLTYTLNCEVCGAVFYSDESFPKPQLCPKCLLVVTKAISIRAEEIKICALQAIADEDEYPGDMPDVIWQDIKESRSKAEYHLRLTVRLTKDGITERFLKALTGEGK